MTTYWPATSSPGDSLGEKEKRVPQFRQNPSARPGRPSRGWPTSSPQFPQNRRFSGTRGSASTAASGSRYGTGGTSTSPAPSLPREDRPLPARVPRLPRRLPVPADTEPGPQVPLATLPPAPGTDMEAAPVLAPAATAARLTGTAAAARPQTSQYPSSIVPPHPGWVHAAAVMAAALPS